MELCDVLTSRLEEKGLSSVEMTGFIRDVARIISSDPGMALDRINHRIKELGWHAVVLDSRTLELIVNTFMECTGPPAKQPRAAVDDPSGLKRVIDRVYEERGFDFRGYSQASLARRLKNRMQAGGATTYDDYIRILDRYPDEYKHLFNEFTINVTRFMRDKDAFEALGKAIAGRQPGSSLRIWSAGCATGQEPYTVAMLVMSLLPRDQWDRVSIIATDIDDTALAYAKEGLFEPSHVQDVAENWLTTFFTPERKRYRIVSDVRDRVVFAAHNLVTDPPYEDLDVILCRNLMIYFNIPVQMRVNDKFYQGLKKDGHLLLGRYEMLIKTARNQFACVDFNARLYRKR